MSTAIDILLQPLILLLLDNLKCSTDLILYLEKTKFSNDISFCSIDIIALYPSIPIDYGLIHIRKMLTKYIKCIPHVDDIDDVNFITDMIEFVWKHNYVQFGDRTWLQTQGTAMGSPCAPSFANTILSSMHIETIQLCNQMTEHNPFCLLQELPPFDSPSKPEYNYCINDEYNFVLTPESQIKYNIKHLVNNSIYPIDEIRFTKLEFHTRYIDDMLNLDKN